jgi:hypothetical protein
VDEQLRRADEIDPDVQTEESGDPADTADTVDARDARTEVGAHRAAGASDAQRAERQDAELESDRQVDVTQDERYEDVQVQRDRTQGTPQV